MRIYGARVVAQDRLVIKVPGGFRVVHIDVTSTDPADLDLYTFTGTVNGGTAYTGFGRLNTSIPSSADVRIGEVNPQYQQTQIGYWRLNPGYFAVPIPEGGLWIPDGHWLYVLPSGAGPVVNVHWTEV